MENRKVESITLGHNKKFQLKGCQAAAAWNPRMVGVGRALPVLLTLGWERRDPRAAA